jgi:nucleotide-binding universal stress UspA family protein
MKVLVAVEPSESADRVTDAADRLFADADRIVLTVADSQAPVVFDPLGIAPMAVTDEPRDGRSACDVAAQVAERLDAIAATRVGDPATAICELAEDEDVDVIVMGAQHGGLFRRLLDPAVLPEVLRRTSRPVLVVPSADRDELRVH